MMGLLRNLFGTTDKTVRREKVDEARNFDVLKRDGMAAVHQQQNEHAILCLRSALELKDDLVAREFLAIALVNNNNLREGFEEMDILSKAQPDNLSLLLRMAEVAYMMEDYHAMTDVCERARQIDSDNLQVNYAYARASIGQGNLINAVALLTKVVSVPVDANSEEAEKNNETRKEALILRGNTLMNMGDLNSAAGDAAKAVGEFPDAEEAWLLMARCSARSNEDEEALGAFARVLELNPFSAEALRERGALRLKMGDKQGAADDARALLEMNPEAIDTTGQWEAKGTEAACH